MMASSSHSPLVGELGELRSGCTHRRCLVLAGEAPAGAGEDLVGRVTFAARGEEPAEAHGGRQLLVLSRAA